MVHLSSLNSQASVEKHERAAFRKDNASSNSDRTWENRQKEGREKGIDRKEVEGSICIVVFCYIH